MKIKSNGSITPNPFSIQQYNNNVDIKCFEIPRFYYGNTDSETDISELYDTNPVDLSKCSVVMRLSNPDDKILQSNILFLTTDKGENEFSDDDDIVVVNWIITDNVSQFDGKRTYQLEFYDGDVLAFRTQVMNFIVKKSLDTEENISQKELTILEQLEDELNEALDGIGGIEKNVASAKESADKAEECYVGSKALNDSMTLSKNELDERIANITDNASDMAEVIDAREGYTNLGARLDKKPCFFNSVDEMKTSNKLKNGDVVETLGYYSVNDGGSGTYKIRTKTDLDVIDNGSIIEISNDLVAELIVKENNVSPQQFGAYGDGIHDDTKALQACIDYAEDIVVNNDVIASGEPVILLYGTYKITDTLILTPYLKYQLQGNPSIISYLTTGTAVQIKYRHNIDNTNKLNDSTSWTRGDMFFGGCLHIVNHYDRATSTVIGLEINNTENPNNENSAFARGSMGNISVRRFAKGIKLNDYHCYIYEFRNLVLYYNDIDFEVGDPGDTNTDFGENISFRNCLFGTSNYGFKNNIASSQYSFYSCSFDFNEKGAIYINKQCTINIYNGWFEGCLNNNSDLSGIIATPNDNIYGAVNIHTVRFMQSHGNVQLLSGKNLTVNIDNISEAFVDNITDSQARDINAFYISKNANIISNVNRDELKMTSPHYNMLRNKSLSDEIADTSIVNGGSTTFVKYAYADDNTTMKIGTDDGEKVVSIKPTGSNNFSGSFYLDELIPVERLNNRIAVSFMYKAKSGIIKPVIAYKFFNENKEAITTKTWVGSAENNLLTSAAVWQKPYVNPYYESIPEKTKYVRVQLEFDATQYCPEILVKNFHVEIK